MAIPLPSAPMAKRAFGHPLRERPAPSGPERGAFGHVMAKGWSLRTGEGFSRAKPPLRRSDAYGVVLWGPQRRPSLAITQPPTPKGDAGFFFALTPTTLLEWGGVLFWTLSLKNFPQNKPTCKSPTEKSHRGRWCVHFRGLGE
jgi:hypothetical protein